MKVEHDPAANRFSARVDGGEAYLEYEERGPDTLDLLHTIVPPEAEGKGVGSTLVESALRYAREHDRRIIPSCPFVQSWLAKHPEYRDQVAEV